MKTRIIRIGNSQGIRIPKLYLQQTGLGEEVELEVQDSEIVIRSTQHPRQGWDEAFQVMAAHGDDKLLDALDRLRGGTAVEMCEGILKKVRDHARGERQDDDLTLIAAKIL